MGKVFSKDSAIFEYIYFSTSAFNTKILIMSIHKSATLKTFLSAKRIFLAFTILAVLQSCDKADDGNDDGNGNVIGDVPSFSSYVAIGNSITQGYADGAAYRDGQEVAYPSLLKQQLSLQYDVDYNQALLPAGNGMGIDGLTVVGKMELVKTTSDCDGEEILTREFTLSPYTVIDLLSGIRTTDSGPFHNIGVAGATVGDALNPALGNNSPLAGGNPFYHFYASNPGESTMISDAVLAAPNFFSYWLGNNDVLTYALGGGENASLTNTADFESSVSIAINELTNVTPYGAILNIASVTDIPYFTYIPYNGLVLTADEADNLNTIFASDDNISFSEGQNAYVIEDTSAPNGMYRQIKSNELVLIDADKERLKCEGYGSVTTGTTTINPIQSSQILDETEIANITARTESFNNILDGIATSNDLILVDVNDYFKQFVTPQSIDGVSVSSEFIYGGLFSLDAIHPTPRGHALVANKLIENINSKYNLQIATLDISNYTTVAIP